MSREKSKLPSIILQFKSSIKDELDNCEEFEIDFNGEEPLEFIGFQPEENKYLVEKSDALLFNDPEAYLAEISKWKDSNIKSFHADTIQYLKDSEQLNTFKELILSIKRYNVTPFIGAGLSSVYDKPLWDKFLKDLKHKFIAISESRIKQNKSGYDFLDDLNKCIEEGDYIKAADLMYSADETTVESAIRTTYTLGGELDRESLKGAISIIPELCDGCVITTNYDGIIEEVYRVKNKPMVGYMHGLQKGNKFVSSLIGGKRCILKLHGDYEDSDSYILTQSQYDEAYGSPIDFSKRLPRVLRQLFISSSLLFLGCSLNEDMTFKLFNHVSTQNNFEIPNHYAFLADPQNHAKKQHKSQQLHEVNIRPIWYTNESENHSEVEQLLKLARDSVKGILKI